MITLVSQNRTMVIETNFVKRSFNKILCHSNSNNNLETVGTYNSEKRAQEVLEDIINEMCKKEITRFTYDYGNIWGTSRAPKSFELPKE